VRFELTTSALPRRRSVRWSYRGDVPRAGLEPACADFKDRPGCPATHPGMEPSPGADPGLLPYRGRVTAVCDGKAPAQAVAVVSASRTNGSLRAYAGAGCPRRESDSHCQRPRRCASYQIGLRGRGAATRCRPGPSAVRGRSRSRARRRELGNQDSNLNRTGQSRSCYRITPFPTECGRRDSSPHYSGA
jgi:hypothetical protein